MEKNILDLLDDKRIFSVAKNEKTGGYLFTEECDRYFNVELTKEQFETLIEELTELLSTHVSEKD